MAVSWAWVGAAGPDGARVVAKIGGASARLAVSPNADLSAPAYFGPVSPGAAGTVSLIASGLAHDTQYYWAVEDAGTLDTQWTGRFHTHGPIGQPYSFTFAAAGDAGLTGSDVGGNTFITSAVSNRPIFDTIRAADPLFFVHLGDLHYRNIASGLVGDYRTAYNDVLTFNGTLGPDARQGMLYRETPTVYMWDDHDYSGNDSNGTYAGKAAAAQAYRECVPSYPLADDAAIFHTWQVGRVMFVAMDSRYDRSPDSDPDGPAKTMLGPTQMAWLEQILVSSTAEALVFCSQVQWASNFVDSWGNFADERGKLAALFDTTGWTGRMVMLMADKHSLGLDSGASNTWGGFPMYLLASMDASPGDSSGPYDLGISGGRDRWGTVTVVDDGERITLTTVARIGSSIFAQHAVTITPKATPPPPLPAGPPVVAGVASRSVDWIVCDLVTGRIIADLPEVRPQGPISRVLGAYTSCGATIPIPLGGPAALGDLAFQGSTPGRTLIVAVVNGVPVWGGISLARHGGSDAALNLSLMTCEGYLARRKVRDHVWSARDQVSAIAAGLVADAGPIDGIGQGIGLALDAPASGVYRDRTYLRTDRKSIYDALRELMAVDGGIEWTIDLDWADASQTTVAKTVRIGNRIGVASAAPNAVFESQGSSQARYELSEDYSEGRGANYIVAYSSGEGDSQPESDPAIDTDALTAGWPIWEEHFEPSTSITDKTTLGQHAAAELARVRRGANTWTLSTRWDAIPRLGIEWRLGDDIGWQLIGHRHPQGVSGVGRAIGWQMDVVAGVVAPILLDPTGEAVT